MAKPKVENKNTGGRLRYSVSLIAQGKHQFYTLTMPSNVLSRTCAVSTREEDPQEGFQRTLDKKRAKEIAHYIDEEFGTIPNAIVLSAQPAAGFQVVSGGKTVEFTDAKGAFLILDGQHRVYGFSLTKKVLRVPVVIYNKLSRQDETRLFIDINTKQRPVPNALLLDIKNLADIENESEAVLREIFDLFDTKPSSSLKNLLSRSQSAQGKINRVTFNAALKPLLAQFADRSPDAIYKILDAYLGAITTKLSEKFSEPLLSKPIVLRALMGLFPAVATRVKDKFDGNYSKENFEELLNPIFSHFPKARLSKPGYSWVDLRDYLEKRMVEKTTF
ncbi:MAG: DGQHR domain-containing protein [Pseudomonadota bacterium]